jgi:Xaa-Pro aminopeptidase
MHERPLPGRPAVDRPTRLLAELARAEIHAELMLVTSLVNVRYLTGFTGSSGAALIGSDRRVFLTDSRYTEQASGEVDPSFDRHQTSGALPDEIAELLGEGTGELALGFEDADLTVRDHAKLRAALPERVRLVAAGEPVAALRAIKEPEEVERIRAATELADAAMREIMAQGLVGRTEAEVALALEDAMRRRGASAPAFETIVAAGPRGALPHATPRDVAIEAGALVVVDWGAVLDGYCSDCTRTLATGDLTDEAKVVYDLVREAQLAGLEALGPARSGKAVDARAREVIEGAGHGEHFGHSLGHGVGLEVHELPRLSPRFDDELAVGNVVSCEPGIYVPGELGVRIEDLCVVTESGCEILTQIPKELITVG